jgi:transposase
VTVNPHLDTSAAHAGIHLRKWSDVRADRTDLTDRGLAEARRKLLAERATYARAEIRKEAGLTRTDVANAMGASQNRVPVIEHGDLAHTEQ